ncbi:hypothetical protein EDC04DRAFT_2673752 [Pisolithus marmoratus]|nr:hypothetical protein EDC04DRAFT_2673752 [Pisolithus marmoratus]
MPNWWLHTGKGRLLNLKAFTWVWFDAIVQVAGGFSLPACLKELSQMWIDLDTTAHTARKNLSDHITTVLQAFRSVCYPNPVTTTASLRHGSLFQVHSH